MSASSDIIPIHNQGSELRVDSRDLAKAFGVQHDNLQQLIGKNEAGFKEFGPVLFETGPRADGRTGGDKPKFCHLNESQTYFLLTLTRNTEATVALKKALIHNFQEARRALRPVDSVLLSLPSGWDKTFPDDFYRALHALYGHDFNRSDGPHSWVGGWTNKFIYEPLWNGLSDELKAKRKARSDEQGDAAFLKLHQFLEENAKKALERHITRVTVLLQASTSPEQFRELYSSVFQGATQLLLTALVGKKRRAA